MLALIGHAATGQITFGHEDWLTWEDWGFKGDVKSMEEYSYSASYQGNSILKDSSKGAFFAPKSHTLKFTKQGQLVDFLEYQFDNEDSGAERITYTYTANNQLATKTNHSPDFVISPYDSLIYNSYGLLIEKWGEYGDTIWIERRFIYINDSTDKVLKEERFSSGELFYTITNVYDNNQGLLQSVDSSYYNGYYYASKITNYNSYGAVTVNYYDQDSLIGSDFTEYNDLGLRIAYTPKDGEHQTFHYDQYNNLIQVDFYYESGNIGSRTEYVYDLNGSVLFERDYDMWGGDKDLSSQKEWQYNNLGFLKMYSYAWKFLSPVLDKTVYLYEYDNYGNWIKQVVLSDTEDPYIVERSFTYYNE